MFTKKFLPFIILGLVLISVEALAQGVMVTVRFRKKGSGDVISRTEVAISSAEVAGIGKRVQAAADGTVTVEAEESALLRFSRFGFKPLEVKVIDLVEKAKARLLTEPQEGQIQLKVDIFLEPALGADDTVIVQGKKRPGVSKQIISVEEARRVAPGGDPGQVTKLMPGVQRQAFGSQVVIRGSAPGDSK